MSGSPPVNPPLPALVILVALAISGWIRSQADEEKIGTAPAASPPPPWGEAAPTPVFLEAPEENVALAESPISQTIWRFPGHTPDEVAELLDELVLDPGVRRLMIEKAPMQEFPGEVRVYPYLSVLRALVPDDRERLYRHLASAGANAYHRAPVFIDEPPVAAWFGLVRLPPVTLQLIGELAWPVGGSLAFSDIPALFAGTESVVEERSLHQALTRQRSFRLEIRIPGDLDPAGQEEARRYWSADNRNENAALVLDSILRSSDSKPGDAESGEFEIDLLQLLPPWPRQQLNRFPSPRDGMAGRFPNSFYTSLNFFAAEPDPELADPGTAGDSLASRYSETERPFRYGDIHLFSSPDGLPLHACVHLVDDFVFTKAGDSILHPWIILRFDEVAARFSVVEPPRVTTWRQDTP